MAWSAKQRLVRVKKIKKRDGNCCWLCQKRFTGNERVTIDHAIPKARGGTNDIGNLRLAHFKCNQARGMIVETPPRAYRIRLERMRFPLSILELTADMMVRSAELQAAA